MGTKAVALDPITLLPFFKELDGSGTLYLAFSGGLDSTALLLTVKALREQLRSPVKAIHVNHGVHPDAGAWAAHCAGTCQALNLECIVVPPPEKPLPSDNPEARFRALRHEAFDALLQDGDVLLTGHHQQDQAETLLLALLRSSGADGLAGMPAIRPFGRGKLARPFLQTPRIALETFVTNQSINFIEDPSNKDTALDRNFLRHEVIPVLQRRWPGAESALATSAGLLGNVRRQLEEDRSLALAGRAATTGVLDLGFLAEDPNALAEILRAWLRTLKAPPLPRSRLKELIAQLGSGNPSSAVAVHWEDHHLRHYQNRLYYSAVSPERCLAIEFWSGKAPAKLGPTSGTLTLSPHTMDLICTIGSRQGGERFRPRSGSRSKSLKQWMASQRIPPWLRESLPLIYHGETLVAVGDRVLCESFGQVLEAADARLEWCPSDPVLAACWNECARGDLRVK